MDKISAIPRLPVISEVFPISSSDKMGSAILEFMADNQYTPMVKRLGIEDKFIQHGPVKDLYALCHIDEAGILHALTNMTNL